MSRPMILKLCCVVVMCMALMAAPSRGKAASMSCGKVAVKVVPCLNYLAKGGQVPELCCAGLKSLFSEATNSQDVCKCIKSVLNKGSAAGNNTLIQSSSGGKRGCIPCLITTCSVSIPALKGAITDCNKEEG